MLVASEFIHKLARLAGGGNILRAFTTTFMRKLLKGPRLIADPNGKNVKDWIICHREPKSVLVGYGSGSTNAKQSACNDGLANLNMLKVRSTPNGDIGY